MQSLFRSAACLSETLGEMLPLKIAAAPPGSWISQWRVGETGRKYTTGVTFLQGVLNDGTTLPPLGYSSVSSYLTLGDAPGWFTEVHGRCAGLVSTEARSSLCLHFVDMLLVSLCPLC
jgi:hypothetical protein